MAQRQMIKIVIRLQNSKAYRALENFYLNGLFVKSLFRKIKMYFAVLKRRIGRIIRKMRLRGVSDGRRMYFYKLVCKFLPAFVKAWKLGI